MPHPLYSYKKITLTHYLLVIICLRDLQYDWEIRSYSELIKSIAFVYNKLCLCVLDNVCVCCDDAWLQWPYRPGLGRDIGIKTVVASGHNEIWRPPAADRSVCDLINFAARGRNYLWRPPAAKVRFRFVQWSANAWSDWWCNMWPGHVGRNIAG